MSGWIEKDGLAWRPLGPLGIEIDGDLGGLDARQADRFRALFDAHGLILARGQSLSMDRQIALMRLIGPLLRGVDGSSLLSSEAGYAAARAELTFHSDYAFTDHPIQALSLHAIDIVDDASSTRFAGTDRGWTLLDPDLRGLLESHDADMIMADFDTVIGRACDLDDPPALLRARRPAVLIHPRTGRRCVGVGEMHAARLFGLDLEQSRAVLRSVFDRLYAPDNVFEHVWRRGDIVVWDNIAFQHARGSLASAGRRILQRVAIGERSLEQIHPAVFHGMAAGG